MTAPHSGSGSLPTAPHSGSGSLPTAPHSGSGSTMVYPFSAVLGQEPAKTALLLALVNPAVGGVLLCGERGTAKSVLLHAACALLPGPAAEVPLNCTEDRLNGGTDLERTLAEGRPVKVSGLLAEAAGGILLLDEINLLADHLTAALLTAHTGPSKKTGAPGEAEAAGTAPFLMLAAMDPEEGELHPQLLDRFGLFVGMKAEPNGAERTGIVRRELDFERDPDAFCRRFRADDLALSGRLERARRQLPLVSVSPEMVNLAASLSAAAGCAGSRAELSMVHAARAAAALDGREAVQDSDIRLAAGFALPHRVRTAEMLPQAASESRASDRPADPSSADAESAPENGTAEERKAGGKAADADGSEQMDGGHSDADSAGPAAARPGRAQQAAERPGSPFDAGRWLIQEWPHRAADGSGRRSRVRTDRRSGRYVASALPDGALRSPSDLALDATLRAAALHAEGTLSITPEDWRMKRREKRTGNTILFVVDASASVGAERRMRTVKTMILSLLQDAYQKRDRVGLAVFRGDRAVLLLPFTRSVERAELLLRDLPTGGRTPLAEGLDLGGRTLRTECRRDPNTLPVLVLVTDGRANSGTDALKRADRAADQISKSGFHTVVFDAEQGPVKLHLAARLADRMGARYFAL